jgi:hypothetical protein
MALEWHFERIQWQLFWRKLLVCPCIFPCYRELGRERFARDCILRHAVWIAEKFRRIAARIAGNGPNAAMHTLKPDRRKRRLDAAGQLCILFSLEGTIAVRFRGALGANA